MAGPSSGVGVDPWADATEDQEARPGLPPGRRVKVSGRGRTFVREIPGPEGSPTVLLIHGWLATSGLNWFRSFGPLAEHFHVVAPDLRGHGQGIRSNRRFTLADNADDLAALIRQESYGPVIAVGYSMGGPIAQLLWKRHPELVAGLVLCATGAEFVLGNREKYAFAALTSVAIATTRVGQVAALLPSFVLRRLTDARPARNEPSATVAYARREMTSHNVRALFEAGHAIANFSSSSWIHEVDVPTSVLVTANDRAVSPVAQSRLALAIPNAHMNRIDDGHAAASNPDFGRKVRDMCLDVARRIDAETAGLLHHEQRGDH
jgi:pimeloyl-ACP methyl ester carboxylesterase